MKKDSGLKAVESIKSLMVGWGNVNTMNFFDEVKMSYKVKNKALLC